VAGNEAGAAVGGGQVRPDAAPAARQHAGSRRGGGVEADQDLVQQRVGEAADAVLAGAAAAAALRLTHWQGSTAGSKASSSRSPAKGWKFEVLQVWSWTWSCNRLP